ncbi:MAG: hypothetical protein L3K07_04550 [Thermoplasmata archaeon]|nr:hypothetical protein [Thermoplasmata archaeon]
MSLPLRDPPRAANLSTAGPVQWPLIGVATLLVLLLLLTPSLLSPGSPVAGSPQTQAVLVVYFGAAGNRTQAEFQVQGVEPAVYAHISVGIARALPWPPVDGGRALSFGRWVNTSNEFSNSVLASPMPLAVNVTAIFTDRSGGTAYYVGLYAFNVSGSSLVILALTPSLMGNAPTSLPLSELPFPLPLALVPAGSRG